VFKSISFGLIIFIAIFMAGLFKRDLGLVVNIAGGVGIFSIIIGAFLKGVFGARNAAVTVTQDKNMSNLKSKWANVIIIIGILNLIGSLGLYLYTHR